MPENDGTQPVGIEMMKDLVTNLALSNRNAEVMRDLLVDLRDLIDELNGNFDVLHRTMEMLNEQRGKKLSLADFSQAWTEASEEVYEDDEPDQGDPLVGADR